MAEHAVNELMQSAMDRIRGMVDPDTVVGTPLTTPDGTTLIPVSRLTFGFASGGGDKTDASVRGGIWGGGSAAVKVEPVGFLMSRDGTSRMLAIQPPAFSTADRLLDMVPEALERLERYLDKTGKKGPGQG